MRQTREPLRRHVLPTAKKGNRLVVSYPEKKKKNHSNCKNIVKPICLEELERTIQLLADLVLSKILTYHNHHVTRQPWCIVDLFSETSNLIFH